MNVDVGSFSTHADGTWDKNWGTCTLHDCSGNRSQSDTGTSVAVGWKNKTWSWDIGTTPMGFNVVDVVGGVSYSNDIGPLGYTLNAHRRPISSSLLAFGGQKDAPSNTGTKWGGVRADGGGVSLSYDKGEANGVWASLSGDQLTGKNVADNWRVRWMTGYYYKIINENKPSRHRRPEQYDLALRQRPERVFAGAWRLLQSAGVCVVRRAGDCGGSVRKTGRGNWAVRYPGRIHAPKPCRVIR
ncbi:cellulose synthase subunit BcsC [Citrobacter koseri]|uniref:Cellulose synthase subunit BcsC n=1 Tax=Citrobacter koseri TaxID=545 RepID=A0A2X2WX39_CITKO|nr:cellulose synthase subunit BcsC [Citrobacter koseri]